LFNKAIQGTYPPGSTWKLATSVVGLESKLVTMKSHMPISCSGGLQYGRRYFKCWEKRGHGSVDLAGAITHSCDVYFYQLGLKIGMANLIAGGIDLDFGKRSGIDLPNEYAPRFPTRDYKKYYDRLFGANWSSSETLNLAIGQGANSQTVATMAKFYTALATEGTSSTPELVSKKPEQKKIINLTAEQFEGLRLAMAGVTSAGGTAASANIKGLVIAGKTGSAQNTSNRNKDHAWFVGFAPAEDPKIVVAVFLEFGEHGYFAARVASKIIGKYLGYGDRMIANTEGG
jgi:penicillin-binding protein 2